MSAEDRPQHELPALTVTVVRAVGATCGVCRGPATETFVWRGGGADISRCGRHAPSMRRVLRGNGHTLVDHTAPRPDVDP